MRIAPLHALALLLCSSVASALAQGALVPATSAPLPCDPEPLGRVVSLGVATPGTLGPPELAMVGLPIVGASFRLEVRSALPWAPGYLVFGRGQAPTPLPALGAVLYPNVLGDPLLFRVGGDGVSGPLLSREPVSTATCGLPLVAQAFVLDPGAQGGVAVTKGAEIRFGLRRGRLLFTTGGGPTPGFFFRDLAVGDFDADGLDDVAAVTDDSTSGFYLDVFQNNGRARFREVPSPALALDAVAVEAGDVDDDGLLDLVVGRRSPVALTVLFGAGDATFTTGPDTAIAYPTRLALGDVNRDGWLDVGVTTASSSQVEVFLGAGDGSFASATVRNDGLDPGQGLFADVDGNGVPDLVVGSFGNRVSRFLGAGDGTFGPVLHQTAQNAYAIATGDFDEDGAADVVTLLDLVLSDGSGGLAPAVPLGSFLIGPVALDVDADGSLDLVARDSTLGPGGLLLGAGDGTFRLSLPFAPGARGTTPAAAGDFEGKGTVGLAVGGSLSFAVHFASEDGGLLHPFVQDLGIMPSRNVYALAIGDLDGDPFADVVAGTGEQANLYVSRGKGDGTLEDPLLLPSGTASGGSNYVSSLCIADLDADGLGDLLASVHGVLEGVQVRYAQGGGAFGPYQQLLDAPTETVAARDLDGDGVLDVLSTNPTGNTLDVRMGTGAGTFAPLVSYPCGLQPMGMAIRDLDGDGNDDVVTANAGSGDVSVLLGLGDGTFAARTDLPATSQPYSVGIGDLDGDGIRDLMVGDEGEGGAAFLRGLGGGSFLPMVPTPPVGELAWSIRIADVTGDGIEDALVGVFGHVSVLARNESGALSVATYGPGVSATALALGDMNGDLVPDLVCGGAGDSIGVLLQQDLDHEP